MKANTLESHMFARIEITTNAALSFLAYESRIVDPRKTAPGQAADIRAAGTHHRAA